MSVEQMVEDLRERIQRAEDQQEELRRTLAAQVTATTAATTAPASGQADSKLRNGNFGWNRNDYLYTVDSAAADAEFECAHWFTTGPYVAGTQLLTDAADDNTDANAATTSALMFRDPTNAARRHSLYNTAPNINDPDYDEVNGWLRTGSANMFCQPLSQNWCHAGKKFYVSFIAILRPHVLDATIALGADLLNSATAAFIAGDVGKKVKAYTTTDETTLSFEAKIKTYNSATQVQLENLDGTAFVAGVALTNVLALFSGSMPTGQRLGFGVYDNTAGQRKYLEGTANVLNLRATVKGTPAATVSAKYRIVATTDWGDTIVSNEVTVNRPTDPSYISGNTYVLLQWDRVPGILSYDIYMDTGGVLNRIYQADTDAGAYADQGRRGATPGAWPTGVTLPVAYAAFRESGFRPANWYDDKSAWTEYSIPLYTPAGYVMANTTDRQWLVGGLTAALTGAGMVRGLIIDLLMLSTDGGRYADSALDEQAKRPQSVTMSGSAQGGAGTGGGPVGGDDGGPRCVTESTRISLPSDKTVAASNLRRGDVILTGMMRPAMVTNVHLTRPRAVWRLKTRRGHVLTASASHRVIRGLSDNRGAALSELEKGDAILVYEDGRTVADAVLQCYPLLKHRCVVEIQLEAPEHTYVANCVVSHNLKLVEG